MDGKEIDGQPWRQPWIRRGISRLERDLSAGPPSDPLESAVVPDIKNTPPVDSRALGYRIAARISSRRNTH